MRSWESALLVATLGFLPAQFAGAQTVTFDFDTATPVLNATQSLPFDQTSGGITAQFNSPSGPAFSIQTDATTTWKMSKFSGKYLYDNNIDRSVLAIKFSQPVTGITLTFATADYEIEIPTTIQLTAYVDSNTTPAVGSATARGAYGTDSMPMGTLTFASANRPFNLVEVVTVAQPRGSTVFYVDNISVTASTPSASTSSVSAATYLPTLAPGMFASAFGQGLALTSVSAPTTTLPATLGGISVNVADSSGVQRTAPLIFVSPGQINYVVPAGTQPGTATLTVFRDNQPVASESISIAAVAPGIFTAGADGKGAPAAYAIRQAADATQTTQMAFQSGATPGSYVSAPLDFGNPGDQLYLVLFGTGIRNRSALSAVVVTIGGTAGTVQYAGAQSQYEGLDQINVLLPASLAGRGEVDLVLTADGKAANTVKVNLK